MSPTNDAVDPEILEGLGRYFAERQRQRFERVQLTYGALTKREQQLVREAAVMGYVRGSMAGEVAGRAGQRRTQIPGDAAIVTEVIECCLSFDDLYPVINRVARRAERRAAGTSS